MVGAAYAAVPFYNWFCRATGFNGTTQVATAGPAGMIDRKVIVRFDANTGPGLPWRFEPGRDGQLPRRQRGGAPDHSVGGL
jgi:cytochrome c oxidase assembly protein subunit 11